MAPSFYNDEALTLTHGMARALSQSRPTAVDSLNLPSNSTSKDVMSLLGYLKNLSAPNPTTQLKKEHDRFRTLLNQAKKTTERSRLKRTRIFEEFASLLALHEQLEEKALYAALKRHPETKAIVLEGLQEHHVADLLIAELARMPVTDKEWGSKFHVMGESVEHHLGEEEDSMFPLVKGVLSEKELIQVCSAMERMRAKAASRSTVPMTTKAKRAPRKSSTKTPSKKAANTRQPARSAAVTKSRKSR